MTDANPTYVERNLRATIYLGQGDFGNSGFNTVTLENLRMVASIQKLGPPGAANADIRIYGLTETVMNTLSTIGVPTDQARKNLITLEAGDKIAGMSVVYDGDIIYCSQNYNASPDTFMQIVGITSRSYAMSPATPTSVAGLADVGTMMESLALKMSRAFKNTGVAVKITNPYFAGNYKRQAEDLARAANIEMFDDGRTIHIWPKFSTRATPIPLISVDTGLIGYPTASAFAMDFRCLYNPLIQFGGAIEMKSAIKTANRLWYVNSLSYDLSSQVPNGPWFCNVSCNVQPNVAKP